MSETNFSKCACRHCGGHIAFPPDGIGRTVNCPHCHRTTLLRPPPARRRSRVIASLGLAAGLVALGGGGLLVYRQGLPFAGNPGRVSPIPDPPPADLQRIEQLAFWEISLEQQEGSRLIYVLARLLNEAPKRRYGVRVAFEVRNDAGEAVATATDYIETLDPDEDTRVKALVVNDRAHSAVITGITEQ
jgi:hypothetical protein